MPDPQVQNQMTFSGDYGMDKWVVYKPGSITVPGSGGFIIDPQNHDLGYTPLIYSQWSETPDFSVPREIPQNSGDQYSFAEPWIIGTDADSTVVRFIFQNWGASSKTIYYRTWGFAPSNVSQEVATTSTLSGLSPFVFNGEQNYLKPYINGIATVSSGSPTVNVPHNLGYVPTCMVWLEFGGYIQPVTSPVIYSTVPGWVIPYSIDTTNLTFRYDVSTSIYHYKIYLEPIYV